MSFEISKFTPARGGVERKDARKNLFSMLLVKNLTFRDPFSYICQTFVHFLSE